MWDPDLDDPTPISGLGGLPVVMPEPPTEGAPAAGLGAVVNPATSAEPDEVAPPMSQNAAPEDEDDQGLVARSRSLGPRPRLLDRRAAPVEAPDWGAAANATGQAAVQSVGAAAGGAPLAAGSAAVGLGRGMATAPDQILRIYDAVEMAEQAGEAENAPVGGFARVYQAADRAERNRLRLAAGGAQLQRDEAGTGQGLQAVGRGLQSAGRAVVEGADEAARAAFPVAPEREGDFAVRTGRALGAVPAILGAGAVAGPVAMAGMIGSQTYATTFQEARGLLTRSGMSEEEADRRAADAATANAFVQAGLMTVPFVRLLDRMSPGAQTGVLGTLRQMAQSGAEFAGSNAVGRVVENVLAREGYDSDRELMRDVWESLGPEAVAGAIIPGAAAGARAGARAVAEAAPRASAAPEVREAAGAVEAAMGGGDRAAVEAAIEGFAAATGIPPEVRVRLTDRLLTEGGAAADARYSPDARLIDVALDTDPTLAASRVFHEGAGHAALEFLPARERQALERASDRWLAQPFDVTALRPGADPSAGGGPPPRTNREYLARLNRVDPALPESRALLREEGIAHLAEMHFARSLTERPMVARAIDRLADTMDRLGSALRGQGFTSAESVFRAMTTGRGDRVGLGDASQRVLDAPGGDAVPGASRDSARDGPIRAWHGSPHTFAPERGVRLEDGTEVRLRAGVPVDPAVDAAVRDGRATVTEYPMGRFDIGRIGTGEGAQAYGHGLYFAGNRRVAEGYRDDLSGVQLEGFRNQFQDVVSDIRGESVTPERAADLLLSAAEAARAERGGAFAADRLEALAGDRRALEAIARLSETRPDEYGDESAEAVAAWRRLDTAIEALAPPGALYEVDLHVQPERLLDWDRLAAEQPAPVRDALADIGVDPSLPRSEWGERRGPRGQDIPLMESRADNRFYEVGFVRERPGGWWEVFVGSPGMQRSVQHQPSLDAAREVLRDMTVGRNRPMTGARAMLLAGAMSPGEGGRPGSPATAARALRDRGVQGVRYLDGMSRGAGEGTRNVVTFADDVVEILNRYSAREGEGAQPLQGVYSAVERAIARNPQGKWTGQQLAAALRNAPGVKPEEMAWLGLDGWLADQGSRMVTRDQVLEYLRANDLRVSEVRRGREVDDVEVIEMSMEALDALVPLFEFRQQRGGDWDVVMPIDAPTAEHAAVFNQLRSVLRQRPLGRMRTRDEAEMQLTANLQDVMADMDPAVLESLAGRDPGPSARPTRYAQYQEDGGANYGEITITLPPRPLDSPDPAMGDYRSGHWQEPNVLAHARFNERTAEDGSRVLFVEEIQSDWHQAGRERGYVPRRDPRAIRQTEAELEDAQRMVASADYSVPGTVAAIDAAMGRAQVRNLAARLGRDVDQAGAAWDRVAATRRDLEVARASFEEAQGARAEALNQALRSSAEYQRAKAERDAAPSEARYAASDRVENMRRAITDSDPAVQQAREAMRDAEERARSAGHAYDAALTQLGALQATPDGVPDAPFKTSWPMLAFKRMIAHAVERGSDVISWATGQMQANRYSQGMPAGAVRWDEAAGLVKFTGTGAAPIPARTPAELRRAVGPDLAQRLLDAPSDGGEREVLGGAAGRPIRSGGNATGQAYFYDARLAQDVERLVKPLGARLGATRVNTAPPGSPPRWETVYAVPVTPQMREAVQGGGLPMFSNREGPRPLKPRPPLEGAPTVGAELPAEIMAGRDIRERRALARRWIEDFRARVNAEGGLYSEGLRAPVLISSASPGKVASHLTDDGIRVLLAIPSAILRGRHFGSEATDPAQSGGASAVHHLGLNVETSDGAIPMRIVVRQDPQGRFFYDMRLADDGRLEGLQAARVSGNKPVVERPGGAPGGVSRFQTEATSGGVGDVPRSARPGNENRSATRVVPRVLSDEEPEPRAHGGLVGVPALAAGGLAAPEMHARDAGLPQGGSATPGVVSGLSTPPTIGGGTPDPETRGALQGLEMWRAAAAVL